MNPGRKTAEDGLETAFEFTDSGEQARRLALRQEDPEATRLLHEIADGCDRLSELATMLAGSLMCTRTLLRSNYDPDRPIGAEDEDDDE